MADNHIVDNHIVSINSEDVSIFILKEGYAYTDNDGWMRANASCTLVKTPQNLIIVDTLTPWDGPLILESNFTISYNILLVHKFFYCAELSELNITPDAITCVVSTHGHSDHNGNNNLFLNANRHVVGYCVSNKDVYYAHPFEHGNIFSEVK